MTSIVWANVLLAVPFILAWIGVPLWLTFKRPPAAPDFSAAHAYLAATAALPAQPGAGQRQDTTSQLEPLVAA
jgi:hypothetical protein